MEENMRSSNLVFRKLRNMDFDNVDYEVATYKGVAKKTIIYMMTTITAAVGGVVLGYMFPSLYLSLIISSALTTFIFGLISLLVPRASKICGIIYCIGEGVLVGFISMLYASVSKGIVPAALLSTFMVFGVVVVLFVTNIVKVTDRFRRFAITFGISFVISFLMLYLLMALTGSEFSAPIMLLVCLISTFLAALYLLLDLDNVRRIVEGGAPKEYEWYTAFGLAYTLIWLYIEILRLCAIIFGRRS